MNSHEPDDDVYFPSNLSLWDLIRSPEYDSRGVQWEAVRRYLETDPRQAATYEDGVSPLQYILSKPASARPPPPARVVRDLLRAHPEAAGSVDARDGSTALFHAACNGHEADIVSLLLACNRDAARAANSFGNLPLHVARAEDVARLLLEAYPDGIMKRSQWQSLPLHSAANMMDTESAVLRLFLEEGKRRGIGGPNGAGGIFLRGPGGKLAHVRLLESIVGLTDVGADGALAFLDGGAARRCWEKLVLITEEISSACALDARGDLPFDMVRGNLLHSMVQLGYPVKVIRLALEARPELIFERDELGRTPLAAAAMGDAPREVIRALLHSEQVAARTAGMTENAGRLPLHLAAESGRDFDEGIEDLIKAQPRALATRDATKHMYPFMLAALPESGSCLDCTFSLIKAAPHTAVPCHSRKMRGSQC